jgi:hypothetical protein
MILGNVLSSIFRKKEKTPKECFFCKMNLDQQEVFTLQYSSQEGLHSQSMCAECAKTFNELSETAEELRGR